MPIDEYRCQGCGATFERSIRRAEDRRVSWPQYNGVGLVSDMAVSGESSFTYTYNARNQPDTIANPNSVSVSLTYDNGGRLSRLDRPGGYTLYEYNARDWIYYVKNRNSAGATKYQVKHFWDNVGNITQRAEWFEGVVNYYWDYYDYDGVYRLTREARKHRDVPTCEYDYRYGYDAVGNRTTQQELIAGWTRYSGYDDNDKLTKMGTTQGGNDLATFGYDSDGNMTSVSGALYGSKTLVYNDDNRLTSMTYGGVTDLYYYRYTGLRYRARLAGTYYRYLYNGERVLEELNDSGTMQARYTTENDSYYGMWLHLHRPGPTSLSRFPLYDAIGTARMLVDGSATITDTYHLDAWGHQFTSTGTTPNPYKFGAAWGYITDPSGFLQLGARFYWPEVGRFVGEDPLGEGTNSYAYVGNRPLLGIDPSGQSVGAVACITCVSAAAGVSIAGCAAGCWGAPMGFWNCLGQCLQEVLTHDFFCSLPRYSQVALGLCSGACAGAVGSIPTGPCDKKPCPTEPEPPHIWRPGEPLPRDFPVRGWP